MSGKRGRRQGPQVSADCPESSETHTIRNRTGDVKPNGMTGKRLPDAAETAGDKPPKGGIGFPDIEGDRAAGDYRIGFRTGFTDGYADGLFAGGNK